MWQKRKCSVHNCYLTIAHATVSLWLLVVYLQQCVIFFVIISMTSSVCLLMNLRHWGALLRQLVLHSEILWIFFYLDFKQQVKSIYSIFFVFCVLEIKLKSS